jgi:hypothetical protein
MLLDMHGWNTRNDDARAADQRVLNERLLRLKETLSEPTDEYVEDQTKYMSHRCGSS